MCIFSIVFGVFKRLKFPLARSFYLFLSFFRHTFTGVLRHTVKLRPARRSLVTMFGYVRNDSCRLTIGKKLTHARILLGKLYQIHQARSMRMK